MGITRSITILFIATALLLSSILAIFSAQREYQVALERLFEQSQATILAHPEIQLYMLRNDASQLTSSLNHFLAPEAAAQALAYSNEYSLLASHRNDIFNPGKTPFLERIRAELSVAEAGMTAIDSQQQVSNTGLFASLTQATSSLFFTTPVLSTVDSTYGKESPEQLLAALMERHDRESLSVIGYLAVAFDPNTVLRGILPEVMRVFLTSLVSLLLCVLAFHLIARRLTAPLVTLKQSANRIIGGEIGEPVIIRGNSEFNQISSAFNLLLKEASKHKSQLGLEKRTLNRKVDENASELSEREHALSKATIEIDTTRKQLHRLANYDRLTGLPNRNLFTTQLALLLRVAGRSKKPLALLCLNLNDFNRVNESLGHITGDLALREVAKRLVSCLRSSDMLGHYSETDKDISISRLGGDEFALVLNELDSIESAGAVAQRIIDNLGEVMVINGHELMITPSIGIAVTPEDGSEVESLLRSALTAMQQAESNKQVNVLFYAADMEATGPDDLKLELELRRAIERNELHLHYQPQIDTISGAITSVEALLRWKHSEFGDVSPSRFIPLAERIGVICELGNWVLLQACAQMKAFEREGIDLPRLAINISPQQLNAGFVSEVGEALQSAGLAAAKLELGLSEGILMDNDSSVLEMLEELKEMGVYLSLDNFGTNYAPLGYLSRHPLDEIKIDRSFVTGCDKRPDSARLVLAIIAMARSLGLHTVAEGVETKDEYRFLAANEVRFMRGYLFSKPVPVEELQRLLTEPWCYMTQVQKMNMDAKQA